MNEAVFGALRNPSGCSVLSHSLSRVYLASLRFTQIPLWGTSDTLETLNAIPCIGDNNEKTV